MKHLYLFFLWAVMLYSCTQTSETAKISFNIDTDVVSEIVLANLITMKYDTVRSLHGGVLERKVESDGELVRMIAGRQQRFIYLSPGSEVTIAFDEKKGLSVEGSNERERALLETFDKEYSIASTKYGIVNIGDQEQEGFLSSMEEKFKKINVLLEQNESDGVSPELISILRSRVAAARAGDIYDYPNYYKYKNEKEVKLGEDYFSNVRDFSINDERAFHFPDVTYIGLGIVARDIDYSAYPGIADYSRAQLGAIDESVSNPVVKELLKYNVLMSKINYGGGAGGMEEEIEAFLRSTKDKQKISQLNIDVAKWAHLQQGLDAPEFSAFTREGEEVKLSELKGKNVYIDVWATWCGPCIAEIPSLKKAELKYQGENVEFVSVSIDALKDKEKWMTMVQERELGGTQVMAKGAWQSELAQQYNISSIPRFIFVDEEGMIVSADAPRPSDQVQFDKMLEGTLN